MSQIFSVIQALSGQKNCIVIPRPYLEYFSGDQQSHALSAVLNQLVFWSGKSTQENGFFYKSHCELGEEIGGMSEDQVRRIVDKLTKRYLPGVIEVMTRKVNGTPVKHYRINGDALIAEIFPPVLETAEVRNGNGESAESNPQKCGMETAESPNDRNGESAVSYLYPDHYPDQHSQINKPTGQPPTATDEPQTEKIDYQAVLDAYHLTLPEMPKVIDMTADRKKKLRELWKKYDFNLDRWAAYLRYISKHCRWMLENRPDTTSGKTWRKKNFDYLIKTECYLSVKEERANDLPKVEKLDIAAREDAFSRLVAGAKKPQTPVEEIAKAAAGKAGLGRMNETAARFAWKDIWSQALAQASESDLARLAS